MKKSNGIVSLAAAAVFLAVWSQAAPAQDWPQWRGANRDAKVTGFKAPKTWPQQLAQKWKVTVGQADGSPALVGDRLYVFAREDTDEVTRCLNAADGKEIWRNNFTVQAPNPPSGPAHAGPRSSPAVADGKVVTLGVRGTVTCLSAADGKLIWRKDDFQTWPQFFTAMSPIIADGMCIVQVGAAANGGVVAYRPGDREREVEMDR